MIITKMKYLLFLLTLLPLIGGYFYQDSFFYFIAFLVFGVVFFIVNPKLLNKKFKLNKNHKPRKINLKNSIPSLVKLELLKKTDWLIPVAIGAVILLLYFTYLGVVNLTNLPEKNIYIKYILSLYKYISKQGNQLFILISAYVVGVVVSNKRRIPNLKHNIAISACLILLSFVIMVHLALFTTYVFGIGELNSLSLRSKTGLIVTGKEAVNKKLKTYKKAPHIIGKDYKIDNLTIYQSLQTNPSRGSFYEKVIINSLPKAFTSFFSLPKDNLVLFGNFLLVREIDKQEIQIVTGPIVKLLIQDYLSSKYIKNEPNYEVIGRQEYLKYREEMINKDIKKLDGYIEQAILLINGANNDLSKAYTAINTNNFGIEEAKNKIKLNEDAINSTINNKSSYYSYCINAGYTFYDTFYHTFSKEYCDNQMPTFDGYIATYQKNIRDWNDTISENQGYINEWNKEVDRIKSEITEMENAKEIFNSYKTLLESKKDSTVYELGIFIPEKKIKLALDNVSSKSLADYLATAVHEYLHYTSYVSEEKSNKFEPFFEEGLTEYFARQVIKKELNISPGQGYPLFTRIIEEIAKKVKDENLLNVYLTKDQSGLVGLLNNAYGKDFYEKSQIYFIQLYYSAADNELKIANNIMFRIGGKQIKENELYSTTSELQ